MSVAHTAAQSAHCPLRFARTLIHSLIRVAVGLVFCVLQPTVHAYLSRASSIESLLETSGSSGSTLGGAVGGGGGLVGLPGESLLRAQEGVVLSAAPHIEASATMMQQMQALLPILEQKWPLEGRTAIDSGSSRSAGER